MSYELGNYDEGLGAITLKSVVKAIAKPAVSMVPGGSMALGVASAIAPSGDKKAQEYARNAAALEAQAMQGNTGALATLELGSRTMARADGKAIYLAAYNRARAALATRQAVAKRPDVVAAPAAKTATATVRPAPVRPVAVKPAAKPKPVSGPISTPAPLPPAVQATLRKAQAQTANVKKAVTVATKTRAAVKGAVTKQKALSDKAEGVASKAKNATKAARELGKNLPAPIQALIDRAASAVDQGAQAINTGAMYADRAGAAATAGTDAALVAGATGSTTSAGMALALQNPLVLGGAALAVLLLVRARR